MGYDLHITRKKSWDGFEDQRGSEISLAEWLTVVRGDAEMRLDGCCQARLPTGQVFRHEHPSIAVWTAWPHHGEAGDMAWFKLCAGNVAVKNPDRDTRRKMWRLARTLNAEVQGDDGEFYDSFGNPVRAASMARSYWRALLRHLGFRFIWGDPVGGAIEPQPFAHFPTIDSVTPPAENSDSQARLRRVLHVVIPHGSGTQEQLAAIETARVKARDVGVGLIVSRI